MVTEIKNHASIYENYSRLLVDSNIELVGAISVWSILDALSVCSAARLNCLSKNLLSKTVLNFTPFSNARETAYL
jgi:hypothetical protein